MAEAPNDGVSACKSRFGVLDDQCIGPERVSATIDPESGIGLSVASVGLVRPDA
jgi:hypothetical protein